MSGNKIITTSYELYVGENDDVELMEETTATNPLVFASGVGMMLPKFEQLLEGLEAGGKYDFTLPCEDAYGEYDDKNIIDLPSSIFEQDGKIDEEIVFKGNIVPLIDSEGNHINAQVVDVKEGTVTVDFNHPLAGENLHFIGEIIDVREATEHDMAQFLGGGCGCGCHDCGSDCGDDCCSSCH